MNQVWTWYTKGITNLLQPQTRVIIKNLISYHDGIECLLSLKIKEQANKEVKFITFSTENLGKIKQELKLLNWEAVYNRAPLNKNNYIFSNTTPTSTARNDKKLPGKNINSHSTSLQHCNKPGTKQWKPETHIYWPQESSRTNQTTSAEKGHMTARSNRWNKIRSILECKGPRTKRRRHGRS